MHNVTVSCMGKKDPFRVQDQWIVNEIGNENLIDKVSDPTLPLTFKKPFVEFGSVGRRISTITCKGH